MLQKHSLITAALVATLGLAACSKDKNANVGGAPAPQTQTTVEESDLPQLEGAGTNVNPNAPIQQGTANADGVFMGPNYEGAQPANIDSDKYGKRVTGAVSNDGLLYTSSSTDNTIDVIRGLKRDYVGNSASVTEAKLKFDSVSGQSIVTLRVQENGFPKVYNLVGNSSFDENNEIINLQSARSGNGTKTTGSLLSRGTLQCLDLDGGCESTLVKVDLGYSGSASKIDIVFRQSIADLHFKMPLSKNGNPEYDVMRDLANNSKKYNQSENSVKSAFMNTWEVVNGRAGFTVVITTRSNQLLAFSGPLVSPQSGNSTNIVLKPLKADPNADEDGLSSTGKLSYQNMIGEARLTANNGLGQLRIVFKMRKLATYKQDAFAITFMRRIKPVIDLNDYQGQTDDGGFDGGYDGGIGEDLPSVE
ncbi:hypothetical protein [Bdellovibrio sp. HCB274]|uniref:hypothetical protein n=1 Tax=Bdellovibrio sp. HCB274 TaxID=3394361 RepID=UPI0039B5FE82